MNRLLAGPRRLWHFLQATYRELQRVSWPTREQTIRLSSVVIGVCVVLGGLLAAGDYGLGLLLGILIR
jgi:preprotein translocase SecE subunit